MSDLELMSEVIHKAFVDAQSSNMYLRLDATAFLISDSDAYYSAMDGVHVDNFQTIEWVQKIWDYPELEMHSNGRGKMNVAIETNYPPSNHRRYRSLSSKSAILLLELREAIDEYLDGFPFEDEVENSKRIFKMRALRGHIWQEEKGMKTALNTRAREKLRSPVEVQVT